MSSRWRRFEVLLPLQFNDGRDVPREWFGEAILEVVNQSWQDMTVLVKLRNEIIHYKSKWGKEMERQKLYQTLQHLRLLKPPFIGADCNFFPHQLLGAACAAWTVRTAVTFLNGFYNRMGIESPLKPYMEQFAGL